MASRFLTRNLCSFLQNKRKFYKLASVISLNTPGSGDESANARWSIVLDGKTINSPLGNKVIIPHPSVAQMVAQEWNSQVETINFHSMPLTKLAFTYSDLLISKGIRGKDLLYDRLENVFKFDTLKFNLTGCEDLILYQNTHWNPIRTWFSSLIGMDNETLIHDGISDKEIHHISQQTAFVKLKKIFANLEFSQLVGLESLSSYSGSLIASSAYLFPLMGNESLIIPTAKDLVKICNLEEHFQVQRWGNVEWFHDPRNLAFENHVQSLCSVAVDSGDDRKNFACRTFVSENL